MNPRFDRLIPYYRFPDLFSPLVGDKYKPNEKKEEFVGLKNAKLIWQTLTGVGDSVAGAGTSGLTLDRFDTTTHADAALIRLVNNSGSTKTIRGCVIRGKPVIRYSGDQGYIHDSLINYDDILDNGEKKFEFGNNYIASADQLKKLADWHWKNQKSKRHIYQVEISGRCHWYSPGEWYTLVAVCDSEDINTVCECCDVQIEGGRDTAGRTVLTLREIYQNWTLNINALARFIGQGNIQTRFSLNRIKIASSTYTDRADVYCDGVDDQIEINKAINTLAGMGGGTVELTEGTFYISAAIVLEKHIAIVGQGWNTIIEKNCNDHGIKAVGSSGNEKYGIHMQNLKITRNSGDTSIKNLLHLDYISLSSFNNIITESPYNYGIFLDHSSFVSLFQPIVLSNIVYGILIAGNNNTNISVINPQISGGIAGIYLESSISLIDMGQIKNTYNLGIYVAGGTNNRIQNTNISECAQFAPAPAVYSGIYIEALAVNTQVFNNVCYNNGTLLVLGQCESLTAPYINNDGASTSNATFARDNGRVYEGGYSYKHTITATGSVSKARFCDNETTTDMHELCAGKTYALSGYVYVPSVGGPLASEVTIHLEYYSAGAWNSAVGVAAAGQNAWEFVTTGEVAIPATATGVRAYVQIAAAASNGEYCYWDNLRLKPVGTHNLHNQNFYDGGTNTYYGI